MRRYLIVFAAILGSWTAVAHAYSGYVTGRVLFYDTRTYTANPGQGPYTTTMKNTWRGLRHVRVYLRQESNGAIIGSGSTDGNGNFTMYWSSPSYNPSVSMRFYFESAFTQGGVPRFRIATSGGGNWVSWTWPITAVNGSTASFGNLYYGSTTSPHKLATMFATATDFWLTLGQYSNNLISRLKNVQVRFPVAAASTGRTMSRTRIEMADNWVVFNNSTLAHEFGHVVDEIEFEQDFLDADCSWGSSGHSWDSAEWQSCAASEGFANFVAAGTFFYRWASNPTSYGYNIESGCSGSNQWSESNVARMYWDLYDSVNETYDSHQQPFYWFVDKLNIYSDGTSNRQDREPSSNQNGANVWDFYYHALNSGNGTNVDILYPLWSNCLYDSQW